MCWPLNQKLPTSNGALPCLARSFGPPGSCWTYTPTVPIPPVNRTDGRAVESFPGVGAGGDREQRRTAGLGLEAGQRGGPLPGAHAAAQHDGVMTEFAERVGELVQVRDPGGQVQSWWYLSST